MADPAVFGLITGLDLSSWPPCSQCCSLSAPTTGSCPASLWNWRLGPWPPWSALIRSRSGDAPPSASVASVVPNEAVHDLWSIDPGMIPSLQPATTTVWCINSWLILLPHSSGTMQLFHAVSISSGLFTRIASPLACSQGRVLALSTSCLPSGSCCVACHWWCTAPHVLSFQDL
jgi:hypothetical protein